MAPTVSVKKPINSPQIFLPTLSKASSITPEKKKMAAGVRGMKLDEPDVLKNIFILNENDNEEIEVKGKKIALNRLRVGNRDTKGTKK